MCEEGKAEKGVYKCVKKEKQKKGVYIINTIFQLFLLHTFIHYVDVTTEI